MKIAWLYFFILILLISCEKTDSSFYVSPDNFPSSAETKSQFNNTSFGVYKGVIIGSSGTIILKVNNGNNLVMGYLMMGNTIDTLSASTNPVAGQAIVNLAFNGSFSSMNLSADADGGNASLSAIKIDGHGKVEGSIVHEKSDQQVQCFEGTFTGGLTGIINLTKSGPSNNSEPLYLIEKIDSDALFYRGTGILYSGTLDYTHYFYDNGNPYRTFSGNGKFIDDTFSGSWSSSSPSGAFNGTFSCKRTY